MINVVMNNRHKSYLNKDGKFVIEDYHLQKPFSSFFPGIAGVWGIPLWVFYVNRGQAIASFGTRNKENPIMEFQPANRAYQLTSNEGFRTLIKLKQGKDILFYDAFKNGARSATYKITNRMVISPYDLTISEVNRSLGLAVDIEYFTIPNDNYAALSRKVTIRNLTSKHRSLEVLDGMPRIIPFGINNWFLKMMSRTIEAWMVVDNLEGRVPYIRLRVDATDRPEVVHIREGNFYLSFDKGGLIRPVIDPDTIFGKSSGLSYPSEFMAKRDWTYPNGQMRQNRTPCCMSSLCLKLRPKASHTIYSLIGNMDSISRLKGDIRRISKKKYILKKQEENKKLIENLQSNAFTHSSSKAFDAYCAQNFLDNVLRGGYPFSIGQGHAKRVLQVYSRKHGDLERDYNNYLIEPTYFSQGNGNFRDVNQNRRCDIWFNPDIGQEPIKAFFSFIQTDGYNPLIIMPAGFRFNRRYKLISKYFRKKDFAGVRELLSRPHTPGELLAYIEQNGIRLRGDRNEFLKTVLEHSRKSPQAEHGEGFWTDHWHYCLDMVENYLSVYPERRRDILFKEDDCTFFDNAEVVSPRDERYVLNGTQVFQYGSVKKNDAKAGLIANRVESPNILRTKNGKGPIYQTTLVVKMLTVIANKLASLDPFGVGIEMEADRPNWCDSLNGLPGLLGSSTCETFELKRWMLFLQEIISAPDINTRHTVNIPSELFDLLKRLKAISQRNPNSFAFWNKSNNLKEEYRKKTLMGLSGREKKLKLALLGSFLREFIKRLDRGLRRAYDERQGLHYSYFINEVSKYRVIKKATAKDIIRPTKFKQRPLPLFLEGIVHYMKVADNKTAAKKTYRRLRRTELFDKSLKMYKLCASLKSMPDEIGRCRIFTPGWLENETVWLHMEYKYMLELLRQGLYKEFYDDFKNVFVPFQDPARYGRSILENSSFIVSSAFPQKQLHGNGFIARLSGATAEFVNIWLLMCAGQGPFYLDSDGNVYLRFKPILPGWLFAKDNSDGLKKNGFAFKFLNKTLVVYHNPRRRNTFGPDKAKISQITLRRFGGKKISLSTPHIPPPYSYDVRNGKIERIDLILR